MAFKTGTIRTRRSIRGGGRSALGRQRRICLWPAIAEELPDLAHLADHIEVEVRDHDLIFVAAGLRNDFSAWIAEITLAVKFADIPRLFPSYAINCPDEISIGDGMRRLFQLPQIFREAGHSRRRIEYDFSSVQSQNARAFWKVPVVADVHAHLGILGLEHGITKIPRREIEFLPESRMTMRQMMLAIFPQVAPVGIDHSCGIE